MLKRKYQKYQFYQQKLTIILDIFYKHFSRDLNSVLKLQFSAQDSWVILNPIEQQIKEKIEKIGTPLKNWDIQINYGIKTGCNEAFIIDGKKRKELIKLSPNSADIIRPLFYL